MLIKANSLQIPLKNECVQCVVTSPPYWGLRDYGESDQLGLEATPEEYVANMVDVFREVRRVLKKNGTLWLNLGDIYASQGGPLKEGGGINDILGGKSEWQDYKRSRKPPDGLKPKDLIGIPWRVAFALQADGWWLRQDIIWSKPNPMPEGMKDRCTKAHEYLFLLTKSERYYYDSKSIKEDSKINVMGVAKKRNRRSVWNIAMQPYSDAHFATFPEKLVEPCILAGSKVGDIVFDPFVGSGTTVKVAEQFGRNGVGTDLKWDYLKLAQKRCAQSGLKFG